MSESKYFAAPLAGGAWLAAGMIVYALLLKLVGAESGPSLFGYYLIFAVGTILLARRYEVRGDGRSTAFRRFGLATMTAATGAGIYAAWVVFNTRLLVGGPIPALVDQYERLQQQAAEGADVAAQLAATRAYMASPERFALNVWLSLAIFGIVLAVIYALVGKAKSMLSGK